MKKCGRCAKPAVLHITEIRHGDVQVLHLCEACAKEYLSHSEAGESDADSGEGLDESPITEEPAADDSLAACPNCGITFKEFRSQGRLGCPHDYVVFKDELLPLLENIHNETQHTGKVPKRAPKASQQQFKLVRLKNRLKAAIDDELYEEAAQLRDEIHALESELRTPPRDPAPE